MLSRPVSVRGFGPKQHSSKRTLSFKRTGEVSLNRFLTKDFLSGLMFIAFGLVALYFGQHLALGTSVRMGPGYVPHMLAFILLGLGLVISVIAVFSRTGEVV